ncbi:MAG: elongation factor P [Candidatus Omnitrophica bacterium]|nr:elongation factor P [Candidatus Omnitrophota bacterium]
MSISIGSLKPNMAIILNKDLFLVLAAEHAKLGRGGAFCRVKLKDLNNGVIKEMTLRNSDKIEEAFIERRNIQYLYSQNEDYHFMDMQSYEDFVIKKDKIQEEIDWLKENMQVQGLFFEQKLISLELPSTIELKVTHTEPGLKGDSAKAGTKPAQLETGTTIQVPLFINTGDIIKVNPYRRQYLGRA